ncbi:MAG: ComEC family competence protein [Alphaproteobacteria bacterium]|nr:ComEC family competence protein [Alphaproteobacteria bacterium]
MRQDIITTGLLSLVANAGEKRKFWLFSMRDYVINEITAQKDRQFLWLPVFFAFGIAAYFSLPIEPPVFLGPFFLIVLGAFYGAVLVHSKSGTIIDLVIKKAFIVLLLSVAGFSAAQVRTATIHTPMLVKKLGPVKLTGNILAIEEIEGGARRLILSHLDIERLDKEKTPVSVRLKLRGDMPLSVGQRIEALVRLNPPSSASLPGGFDFRRYLYFKGIGAVGFIYNDPVLIDGENSIMSTESLRHSIVERIGASLDERKAAIASALMVGKRTAITEEDYEAFRNSGLAHLLAISGLHVGLMAGVIFFFIRLGLSSIPVLALNYPIKKIAAFIAILGAIAYMIFAGATISTQRAVLMIGLAFIAIIFDRSPFSLRLIAFAALVTLSFSPEALMSAGFHMSFAAVIGLVVFYEATRGMWTGLYRRSNGFQKILIYFLGIVITTVIASSATSLFEIYHFQKFAALGNIANIISVPLVAFMIMPCALLAFLLMPLGLEFAPLWVMGQGLSIILEVAYWVQSLPGAVLYIGAMPFHAFILLVVSALWIILWKGWGKVLAAPLILTSLFIINTHKLPDLLVSSSHHLIALYDGQGLYVSNKRRDKFTREIWERHYGLGDEEALSLFKREDILCDQEACRMEFKGQKLSIAKSYYAQASECMWADILISYEPIKVKNCNAQIEIGKFDTWRNGAHAIYIDGSSVRLENVATQTGQRPWKQEH